MSISIIKSLHKYSCLLSAVYDIKNRSGVYMRKAGLLVCSLFLVVIASLGCMALGSGQSRIVANNNDDDGLFSCHLSRLSGSHYENISDCFEDSDDFEQSDKLAEPIKKSYMLTLSQIMEGFDKNLNK